MRLITLGIVLLSCALLSSAAEPVCLPCSARDAGGPEVLLKRGNERFVNNDNKHPRSDVACIRNFAEHDCQPPFAVELSCSDSRFSPEILFDQGIGDLFVLRVAGNVATPEVMGSIEYAVAHLNVRYIVVMGHERCGAVKAAFDPKGFPEHLDSLWMRIRPSVSGSFNDANWETATRDHVRRTVEELEKNLRLGDAHDIVIVGAYSKIANGAVELPIR